MIYTTANLRYYPDGSRQSYVEWRDGLGGDGFRTLSLSLTGPAADPVYAAVMVKPDRPFRGHSRSRLTRGELSARIDELAAAEEPLYPYLIAATGSGADVVYAACFREVDEQPRRRISGRIAMRKAPYVVRLDLSAGQFVDMNVAQRRIGRIPISIDAFGTAGDIRYCAIWGLNPDRIDWNVEAINDEGDVRQQRFDALESIKARAELVAMTPAGGVARLFVDSRLGDGWKMQTGLVGDEGMTGAIAAQQVEGRQPVRISATLAGRLTYSIIFAKSDEIVPRTFRVRGRDPAGVDRAKTQAIDAWMESWMREKSLRGAAVAIVEGTRLVYAKGYTLAEPEPAYPDIEPTTLFRMASVSKTFCAVAVWALLPSVRHLDARMLDIVGLAGFGGNPPLSPAFGDITLRHLLESCSGIDQKSVRNAVEDVVMQEGTHKRVQPLTQADIARIIAGKLMLEDPGELVAYGQTDYFLLGLVAAGLAEVEGFEAALKKAVLDPLRMTRTLGSRSLVEAQPPGHARHHAAGLATGRSAIHNDRRLVPVQYGHENYEVYDGAGGISSAIVDLARLCAMFACRGGDNPVMTDDRLLTMLRSAVAATLEPDDEGGYHGFDWVEDLGGDDFKVKKNGLNPAVHAQFRGSTAGRICMIAHNSDPCEWAQPRSWSTDFKALADAIDWRGVDLFPHYDMPSLDPGPRRARPTVQPGRPAAKRRSR